jgi:glycerophosphoryl diester phosphodiesterase
MSDTRRLSIIGHRGARGLAPENTLLGFETALRLGVDGVEFDVQRHPDGELFLLHDLSLERTTNGEGIATEQPWPALRRLDAGQGERLPTLDETLDLIDRRCRINIELKTWNGCAEAVAQCLQSRLAQGWDAELFIVSSFHLPELQRFRAALPAVPIAALYCGVPLAGAAELATLGARQVHLADEFVDADYVAAAAADGRPAWAYTVNTPAAAVRLQGLGVSGIFTDHPERFLHGVGTAPYTA